MKKLLCIIFLLWAAPLWATDVYIDPTASDPSEDGSFAHPYNSWTDFSIQAGNDYRQKCGTTYSSNLVVGTAGSSGDLIIIGAYYDSGGSPVHEDSDPSFGGNCGNAASKPIIQDQNSSGIALDVQESYIELNSIIVENGETTVAIRGSGCQVMYSRILDGEWGIRVGYGGANSDDVVIAYNYLDGTNSVDGTDGIEINQGDDNASIHHNVLDDWEHTAINFYQNTTGGEAYANHVTSTTAVNDHCIGLKGDNTTVKYNKCTDAGDIQLLSGSSNTIAYNIVDGTCLDTADHGIIHLQLSNSLSDDMQLNEVYNNLVYFTTSTTADKYYGFLYYADETESYTADDNLIANNIVLDLDGYDNLRVSDPVGKIGTSNEYRNNLFYNWDHTDMVQIDSNTYSSASNWNSGHAEAYNNLDSDPLLRDPANDEFWPHGSSSPVVGNGYTVSGGLNEILSPNTVWGDADTAPNIVLVDQPDNWYIGPYALDSGSPLMHGSGRFSVP